MPTKIILNKAPTQTRPSTPRPLSLDDASRGFLSPPRSSYYQRDRNLELLASSHCMLPDHSNNNNNTPERGSSNTLGRGTRRRSVVSFKSSLLRELAVRGKDDDDLAEIISLQDSAARGDNPHHASDDIRASPRLTGYLFAMTASAVMLISIIQFREKEIQPVPANYTQTVDDEQAVELDTSEYYMTATNSLVFRWKVKAALCLSAAAVALSFLTLLVHFDTICCPKVWTAVFRDGSLAERNWILCLIVMWAAALHVATSVLSVGEYQANVYFTTWIGFAASALTYGVWRECAGLVSLTEQAINRHKRETTYNWICTGICSAIFAGSATDIYYNREVVKLRYRGEKLDLNKNVWIVILAVVWTEVAVCAMAVAWNEFVVTTWQWPCQVKRKTGIYRFVFGWRQVEGLVILVSMGAKFYAILEYTGVDGVVNGLSNAYFGIWGSFFNSVFAFGTWLRENQNLEWFLREDVVEQTPTSQRAPSRVRSTSN